MNEDVRRNHVRQTWRYRVVYKGGDGAMALYFTNNRKDAERKARALKGTWEGPLDATYWGKP